MNTDTTQPATPTPETDQYVSPCIVFHGPQTVSSMVLADFARKLERERDQWREVARRFHRATAPNGCCIDVPALRGAIVEFERLKEDQ
jgi:hypothetical protein